MKRGDAPIILVIEDEQPLIDAIKRKFELSGFQVLVSRSVSQGLDYLRDIQNIGAIWLDHYLLGKETGLDLISTVKNDEKIRSIPIFVVSNTVTPEKVKSYLALGANKYYTKSNYRLDQIIADVKQLFEESQKNK